MWAIHLTVMLLSRSLLFNVNQVPSLLCKNSPYEAEGYKWNVNCLSGETSEYEAEGHKWNVNCLSGETSEFSDFRKVITCPFAVLIAYLVYCVARKLWPSCSACLCHYRYVLCQRIYSYYGMHPQWWIQDFQDWGGAPTLKEEAPTNIFGHISPQNCMEIKGIRSKRRGARPQRPSPPPTPRICPLPDSPKYHGWYCSSGLN